MIKQEEMSEAIKCAYYRGLSLGIFIALIVFVVSSSALIHFLA